ncbi:MAG: helix-turn-helix transcriptional regulator [Oscillospiraceae bacterium]
MIHAYSESYLTDAKSNLAELFDYAMNDCRLQEDWFSQLFIQSGFAEKFETGNPSVLAGMSGIELAQAVLVKVGCEDQIAEPTFSEDRSPEYWAGWALAEYQWETAKRFKDIFRTVPLSQIISMYPVYHEMDVSQFITAMDNAIASIVSDTRLKQVRENRGLSQSELAEKSGVKLRSIQMYEQRVNDIDKAQSQTLFKLSRVLGCKIEDLLENPNE